MGEKGSQAGQNALSFLILATTITVLVNVLILFLPPSISLGLRGTVQFIWPVISIFVLLNIRNAARDRNVIFITAFFAAALVPWTATLLLWEILLPLLYSNDLAYYITGFGFLACYGIIMTGLMVLKKSKQWYINQSVNRLLNVIAIMGIAGVSALVLANAPWGGAKLPDALILLAYLAADILILIYTVKLMYMNLGNDIRYLLLIIGEFVFINSIGDLLFELRWLFSLNTILGVKTPRITDFIYNLSLIFMVTALMLYNSRAKKWTMEKVNRTIHREKHLMEDVVMQSPEAMCVCDGAGNVTLVNDTLLRLFHTRRANLLGDFNLFKHMAGMDDGLGHWVERLKAGDGVYLPDTHYHRDGGTYHLATKMFPVIGPDGAITSYVCIIDDVTERLRSRAELVDSKRQAELYVDLMAHDINNMNQIAMGFLEIAEGTIKAGGKLDEGSLGLLQKPIEAMVNSSRLIDNVKKLQKEKSGTLAFRETDLGAMLAEVAAQFERVPGRDVTITHKNTGDCRVMANELMKEVFINLVGNAIKHSQGPLHIDIALSRIRENNRDYCQVMIDDTGPGIPDNVKARIFDRFEPDKPAHGKGLGLYLAKTLVYDHNGAIRVTDRVPGDLKQGSRFIVMLPAL